MSDRGKLYSEVKTKMDVMETELPVSTGNIIITNLLFK